MTAADWVARRVRECGRTPEAVLTRGDGPFAEALAEACAGAVVVSWVDGQDEPRRSGQVVRVSSHADRIGAVARSLFTLGLDVEVVDPPDGATGGGPSPAAFGAAVTGWRRAAAVEAETLRSSGASWFENLERNLETILLLPVATALAGALEGRAALVVGSGPSRDRLIPAIAAWRDRVVVVASSSSVRALAAVGVIPDVVVVIEGKDCSADLDGVPEIVFREALLLVKASSHPAHLAWPFAHRAVFLGPTDAWLRDWFGPGSLVPTAGNVGSTSLVLSWMLGADPVLTTGIDFARAADGRGARGGSDEPTETVAGWSGQSLDAEQAFVSYREETEQILATIRTGDPRTRFVSLSTEGARIAGMHVAEWSSVREQLTPRPTPALSRQLGLASAMATLRKREALQRTIGAASGALERLLDDPYGPAIALAVSAPANALLRALVVSERARRPPGEPGAGWTTAFRDGIRRLRRLGGAAADAVDRSPGTRPLQAE